MSLATDIIFTRAIKSNAAIIDRLAAHDVHSTSIALPDEDLDNAALPYVIVTFDGLTNDQSTKDSYEGDTDTVSIGIEVAARNRSELAGLTRDVRRTVRDFFENVTDKDPDFALVPLDYQFGAGPVQFDPLKPCYWQVLNYQCDIRYEGDE